MLSCGIYILANDYKLVFAHTNIPHAYICKGARVILFDIKKCILTIKEIAVVVLFITIFVVAFFTDYIDLNKLFCNTIDRFN